MIPNFPFHEYQISAHCKHFSPQLAHATPCIRHGQILELKSIYARRSLRYTTEGLSTLSPTPFAKYVSMSPNEGLMTPSLYHLFPGPLKRPKHSKSAGPAPSMPSPYLVIGIFACLLPRSDISKAVARRHQSIPNNPEEEDNK